ncbi:hypothetical protein CW304_11465 [Bacillus sp. UFRGS-B20]|nr:hypothetical protein CW304_11465 [Bacillus sp. UFRGS-B20]
MYFKHLLHAIFIIIQYPFNLQCTLDPFVISLISKVHNCNRLPFNSFWTSKILHVILNYC